MTNRITEQTKQWFIEALFNLMKTKDYSLISVTEICKEAQLSRRTFYRRFKTKKAILDLYFEKKINSYTSYIENKMPQNFYELVTIFFSFWEKEQSDLKILQKNNLLVPMLYKFNSLSPEIYDSVNFPWHIQDTSTKKNQINLLLLFSIGGLWNILSNQLEEGKDLSAQTLSTDINKSLHNLFKESIS